MRQVTVQTVISRPREEIFDFVADLANRPAYCDHYLEEFRLARANSRGLGAAARFRLSRPISDEWAEISITHCEKPRRIVEEGRVGRRGRSRIVAVYDFVREADGLTRVELTTYGEPATLIDKVKFGRAHRWLGRRSKRALERLRAIFEEEREAPLARASVAGYDPSKAPRFGDHLPSPSGFAPADR